MADVEEILRKCARLFPPSSEGSKPAGIQTIETEFKEAMQLSKAEGQTDSLEDLGRYRLLAKVGEGGMGEVYKAYDTSLKRTVALKILSSRTLATKAAMERFIREAKATARLRHAHIVDIYDFQQINETYFLVMQFIAGCPLSSILRAQKLPLETACKFILEILDGIAYAHRQGIIHRDLKPSNILVDEDRHLFITDFGLAKALNEDSTTISHTGAILGTPAYMSPEQARGSGEAIDARTDIYSIGAMFYEMLTGRTPFHGESMMALFYKLANEEIPDPKTIVPAIPVCLENICIKALQKEREKRYQSAVEMATDIRMYLQRGALSPAHLKNALIRQKRRLLRQLSFLGWRPARHRYYIGIATAGVILIVAVALYFGMRQESSPGYAGDVAGGENVQAEAKNVTEPYTPETRDPHESPTILPQSGVEESLPKEKEAEARNRKDSDRRNGKQNRMRKKRIRVMLHKMDSNGDGRIGREEWHGKPDRFDSFDRDKDGFLKRKELQKQGDGPFPDDRIKMFRLYSKRDTISIVLFSSTIYKNFILYAERRNYGKNIFLTGCVDRNDDFFRSTRVECIARRMGELQRKDPQKI